MAKARTKRSYFSCGRRSARTLQTYRKGKVSGKAKKEVKEELRERIQVFEGIVIAIKGAAENTMFMVRKSVSGI